MYPHIIDEDTLKQAERTTIERERVRAAQKQGEYTPEEQETIEQQKQFIAILARTFSAEMARKAIGISKSQLNRWKKEWYPFSKKYNETLETFGERLVASTMQRAMGNYQKDEETETGFVEDAAGNPIVFGGNDKLAIKMLEAIYPSKFGDKKQEVGTLQNPFVVNLTTQENKDDA